MSSLLRGQSNALRNGWRHAGPPKLSRRSVYVLAKKVPLSTPAVVCMREGRRQAARQGSMFLEPQHIVLGLLATPCLVAQHLETQYKLDYETVREFLDSKIVMPKVSTLQEYDVDMSPRTRTTLVVAQEYARDAGSPVLATAHLAGALLQDAHSVLKHILEEQLQVPIREVEDALIEKSQAHPEGLNPDDAQTPEQQASRLKEEYARMQQAGTQPPLQAKAEELARETYE